MSDMIEDDARQVRASSPPPEPPAVPRLGGDEEQTDSIVGLMVLIGLLGVVGFTAGISMVIVILALIVMIFMHEMGHYLTARYANMKVTEFFLGFGPRLWSFRRGETTYGIKAIPAGAYVRIIGMNNLEEVEPQDEARAYRQQSYPKRLLVVVAGSGMHFLMALALLYTVLVSHGIDTDDAAGDRDWSVETVSAGTAEQMGLEPGDRVVAAGDTNFATWTDMRVFVESHPGETFDFGIERDGETFTERGTIGFNGEDPSRGRIGIGRSASPFITKGAFEAVPATFTEFGSAVKLSITSLGDFFSPSGLSDFFGRLDGTDDSASDGAPAAGSGSSAGSAGEDDGRIMSIWGASRIGAELTDEGFAGLLIFLFSINVFVGVFNLVPLLPLDGGHVAVATYERIRSIGGRRHHADVTKLMPLTYAVMLVLITVGLAAIYLDVSDPISL